MSSTTRCHTTSNCATDHTHYYYFYYYYYYYYSYYLLLPASYTNIINSKTKNKFHFNNHVLYPISACTVFNLEVFAFACSCQGLHSNRYILLGKVVMIVTNVVVKRAGFGDDGRLIKAHCLVVQQHRAGRIRNPWPFYQTHLTVPPRSSRHLSHTLIHTKSDTHTHTSTDIIKTLRKHESNLRKVLKVL